MTATREKILAAVRTGLGSGRQESQAIAAEAQALLEAPELIRTQLPGNSPAELFAERVSAPRIGATVERIADLSELPAAVQRYLKAQGLQSRVAVQPHPELLRLDWSGIEVRTTMAPDEPVGVGLARWGIVETGSLVFHSGPDTPILFNFLPLHHLVAVKVSSLLDYLEDYAAAAARAGSPPRNVNLITGASGTTDIEGSYVRGAHGPGFLHAVLVEDRAT